MISPLQLLCSESFRRKWLNPFKDWDEDELDVLKHQIIRCNQNIVTTQDQSLIVTQAVLAIQEEQMQGNMKAADLITVVSTLKRGLQ